MTTTTKTIALLALVVLTSGCESKAALGATKAVSAAAGAAARGDHHRVDVPGGTLNVPVKDWMRMADEYTWAENFQATVPRNKAVYQIVTVFKLPMTDDRRRGVRISRNEYLEVFATNPGEVTVLVRVDKRTYWTLSREMFRDPSITLWATEPQLYQTRLALQPQIDTTRYLLQTFGTENAGS